MKEEYQKFMEASEAEVPQALKKNSLASLTADMGIRPRFILLKLLVLHFAAAFFTLNFCPQFHVGSANEKVSQFLYALMQVHHLLCAAFCGFLFLGVSALLASLVLKDKELFWLKNRAWWSSSVLTLFSLFYFMYAGDLGSAHFDIFFSSVWTLSSIVSAALIYSLVFRLRDRFV